MLECGKQIFIERNFRIPARAPARIVAHEARALFGRIGQLVIAVRKFLLPDVQLEAFGHCKGLRAES